MTSATSRSTRLRLGFAAVFSFGLALAGIAVAGGTEEATRGVAGDPANAPGSGTIALSGKGVQGNLTITPTSAPFGDQLVGTTSAPLTVTLGNNGNASLMVTTLDTPDAPFVSSGGSCGATPITIAALDSCTLEYTFSPTTPGSVNQALTVTADASGSGSIALSGNGVQGNLTISPTTVPFGDQLVNNTSAPLTVTLGNNGTASLMVTTLETPNASFARSGGSCSVTPITIAAQGSCTLEYNFTPTLTGNVFQSLTVTADAPGSGTIALSGNGVQGNLTISPTSVAFGDQLVGTNSAPVTVTLGNNGTTSLQVTTLETPDAPFVRSGGSCSATPITIAASGSCTLEYTFSPTGPGNVIETLTVNVDAPGSGTIELSGNGAAGNLTITPDVFPFGGVEAGTTSGLGTITLGNDGAASLDVTSLSLAFAPFERTNDGTCGNSLPITLGVDASCTLTYRFAPMTEGAAQQMFTLDSTATGETTFHLTGTGTPAEDLIFRNGFEE